MDERGDVLLVGGPCSEEVLPDVALTPTLTVPNRDGPAAYRRTGDFKQLRGLDSAEPYRRLWLYEHEPD